MRSDIGTMMAVALGNIQGTIECAKWGLLTKDEAIRDITVILDVYDKKSAEYLASFGKNTIGAMN